jgi:hypothetical protein
MGGFSNSAGFWGSRAKGHSAGWRWPQGESQHLWVAYFPAGNDLPSHLAEGWRKWLEAVALEEHRAIQGNLPALNRPGKLVIELGLITPDQPRVSGVPAGDE